MNMLVLVAASLLLVSLCYQVAATLLSRTAMRICGGITIWLNGLGLVVSVLSGNIFVIVGISALSVAAILNGARLIKQRLHPVQLSTATRRTAAELALGASIVVALQITDASLVVAVLPWLLLLAAVWILTIALTNIARWRSGSLNSVVHSPPTVTLAIPARNETHVLTEALDTALQINYPKLEILVLDDCSQDSTSQIIRSYAHSGVRFIKGHEPTASWIGKNVAYRTLLQEASGELVLFCGVDVRLQPDSVNKLVAKLQQEQCHMLAILPQRPVFDWSTALVQPLRYFWQLALPHATPPVVSSCWIGVRDTILSLGGFEAVGNAIVPERYFARELYRRKQYRFIIANQALGITTRKRLQSQIATLVRTAYPGLHRGLNATLLAVAGIWLVLAAPFVWTINNLVSGAAIPVPVVLAGLLLLIAHTLIIAQVYPKAVYFAPLAFPFVAVLESAWIAWSMLKYEFGSVIWKGRNICLPVLEVIPSLPPF